MQLGAGELDQRIVLLEPGKERDPVYGGMNANPTEVAWIWAKRDVRGAVERLERGQLNAVNFERFYIRFRRDVSASQSIRWRGQVYRIAAVLEVRTGETLQIDCEARDVRIS